MLGGQSVSAEFRKQLEAEMPDGFVSQNIYGTTEAGGPVPAISTPHTHDDDELQLVNEDTIITEILDPVTLKPVSPGEVGEIVVTTLCREASPVVRWRTRDLVRLSPSPFDCRSGRRACARSDASSAVATTCSRSRSSSCFPLRSRTSSLRRKER
ncbi:hypothetical protein [Bradyrhizobium australafricanum]|uniref:hypothetical protein n=1 Tax=Bradyrhizobium australafricanum TaxID=2821406 RepID=UPI0035DF3871